MAAKGDPRVHFLINLAFSALFATVVLYGSDLVGITEFTPGRVAAFTALLMLITYLATR